MSEEENNKEQKAEKPPRVSRFASKMAKKRSNLDRKLSKMKSKLRDVEDRKEALAKGDADGPDQVDEPNAVTSDIGLINQELPDDVNLEPDVIANADNSDKTISEQDKPGLDIPEKQAELPEVTSKVEKDTEKIIEDFSPDPKSLNKKMSEKKQQEMPVLNDLPSISMQKQNDISDSNNQNTDIAETDINKKTDLKKPDKPKGKSSKKPKPASPLAGKPKPAGLAGIGGLGGGRNKKVKPAVLLQKIIDRLDESVDLKFVSVYRDEFVAQLKNLHNHKVSLAWYCNELPASLEVKSSEVLLTHKKTEHKLLNTKHNVDRLDGAVNESAINSVFVSTWDALNELTPGKAAQLRQFTDIHIIQALPKDDDQANIIPLLERVSRHSGSLIIAQSELKKELQQLQHEFEINRNYTVIEDDRITYIDHDLSSNNLNWLDELFVETESTEIINGFSAHRCIMRIAQMLETACDSELSKLDLIDGLNNPKGGSDKKAFSIAELDAVMKNSQAATKLLLGAKGIQIDELGQINFASNLNESESAQAIVSELSIDDLVREDELDILKFNAEQRKSINRIKRFRFASKLGFLWKLNPEYIEKLHRATNDVITDHARQLHKQTSDIVEKHLQQMALHTKALPINSPVVNAFKRFQSSWRPDEQLMQAVSTFSDLNHFRSAVFSKRGNAAPIEAQRGVLRELRESRMFVSQLMAFGMLGAVLLGSSYAVDVFISWFSGSSMDVGEELTAAAKSSRGLGRQVRILIAGVAGICIVFYLALRMYLRNSEKILDQQRIIGIYSQQLEDVVSSFITESSSLVKEIINADIERFQLQYEEFRASLPSALLKDSGRKRSDQDGIKSTGLGQAGPAKRIEELKKWLNSALSERDNFSIIQTQKTALGEAQQRFNL